jgi:sugar phosphate isomerase/epimerase
MAVFGYHAVYEPDFASAIRRAAAHGFQYVQFDLNVPRFYIEDLARSEREAVRSLAADLGVRLTFHAPGDNVGLFCDYPLVRKGLLDHVKAVLDKANSLGARHLTVHPLRPPSFRRSDSLADGFQEEHAEYFKEVLKENVAELAGAAGCVMLVVENCYLSPIASAALDELIAGGAEVYLALDWAKMHKAGPEPDEDQRAFFRRHKARIRELHLHDLDERGRSHLKPGQGKLEFAGLFREFAGEEQWLTVEVRPFEEARKAKEQFNEILELSMK